MSTLPSIPFTAIDSVRVAVDAPVSTDLMNDICVDLNYLYAGINNANGKSVVVFNTAGNFNWTPPPGITNCWLEMVGGGGGGYYSGGVSGAAGGGSGAFQIYEVSGLTGAAVNLQVGAAGVGGIASSSSAATAGTNSWFGAFNQNVAAGGAAAAGGNTPGAGGAVVNSTTAFGSSSVGTVGLGTSSAGGFGGVPSGSFSSRPAQGAVAPAESGHNFGCGGAGGFPGGTGNGGNGGGGCIIIHY